MPWISPEHKIVRDTLSLKLDVVVMRQLARYAAFLQSTQSYIVTEILRDVFARDKDFQTWLRTRDTAPGESHGDPHGESQHAPPAPARPARHRPRRTGTRERAAAAAAGDPSDAETARETEEVRS